MNTVNVMWCCLQKIHVACKKYKQINLIKKQLLFNKGICFLCADGAVTTKYYTQKVCKIIKWSQKITLKMKNHKNITKSKHI